MSSPKPPPAPPPPQPDAPAAKAIVGQEDTPAAAVKKRNRTASALRAQYLTAPSGVGVQV